MIIIVIPDLERLVLYRDLFMTAKSCKHAFQFDMNRNIVYIGRFYVTSAEVGGGATYEHRTESHSFVHAFNRTVGILSAAS